MKSKLSSTIPSIFLALIVCAVSTILVFIVAEILAFDRESYIAYSFGSILIAAGCYFIIADNPKSFWYVPVVSNALLILASIIEPNFWRGNMWIPICSGWFVTINASIMAFIIGRKQTSNRVIR